VLLPLPASSRQNHRCANLQGDAAGGRATLGKSNRKVTTLRTVVGVVVGVGEERLSVTWLDERLEQPLGDI
jgi:hypothetical protein